MNYMQCCVWFLVLVESAIYKKKWIVYPHAHNWIVHPHTNLSKRTYELFTIIYFQILRISGCGEKCEQYSTYPDYEHLKSQHIYAKVGPDNQTTLDYMNTHPKWINKHTHELYEIMCLPLLSFLFFILAVCAIYSKRKKRKEEKKKKKNKNEKKKNNWIVYPHTNTSKHAYELYAIVSNIAYIKPWRKMWATFNLPWLWAFKITAHLSES